MKSIYRYLFAAVLFVVMATGCTRTETPASSQVLARVNKVDLTIYQLQNLLAQVSAASPAQRADAIERLIHRELAVQKALALHLDSQPDVMLKIEEARRDALATAWADHIATQIAAPQENAVAQYFAKHPGLFTERKLYRFRQITISIDDTRVADIETRLHESDQLSGVLDWMKASSISYADSELVRLAEQLPIEVADRLYLASNTQVVAFRSSRALTLYQIQHTESMPVTWSEAEPIIYQFLRNQSRQDVLVAAMAELRSKAVIRMQEKNHAS